MARPSIVPIALTLDDRTGYTLWAPPWEEDGEEWQAFLGTTEDDPTTGAIVGAPLPDPGGARGVLPVQHRPRPRRPPGLADRGRAGRRRPDPRRRPPLRPRRRLRHRRREPRPLGGRGARRDHRHRRPAGRVPRRQPEDDEDETTRRREEFEAVAELVAKPEIGSLGLGVEAFVGRSGEDAWIGVGGILDDLWEDVVEELYEHLDWTGAGTVDRRGLPGGVRGRGRRPRRPATRTPTWRTTTSEADSAATATTARRRAHHRPRQPARPPTRPPSPRPPSSGRPSASCPSRSSSPRAPA